MKNNAMLMNMRLVLLGLLSISNCSLPSNEAKLKSKGNVVNNHTDAPVIPSSTLPLPRDPQLAVQEEFDAARQKNTIAAWQLFLRRHPENTLTAPAREAFNQLLAARKKLKEED